MSRHRNSTPQRTGVVKWGQTHAATPVRRDVVGRARRCPRAAAALAVGPARAVATAPAAVPAAAPGPGGTVSWTPQGRQVLGRPVLYTGSANGAFVAWMDPELTRPQVVPGTGDPLASPWGGQVAPDQRPFLVSSFNGGFKFGDFVGAVQAFGQSYRSPVAGIASFIVYDDGTSTVGSWGRDNDPAKNVVRAAPEPRPARRRRRAHCCGVEPGDLGFVGRRGRDRARRRGRRRQRRSGVGRRSPEPARPRQRAGRRGRRAGHGARHQPRLGELQLVRRRRRQRRARQRPLRRHRHRPLPRSRRSRLHRRLRARHRRRRRDGKARCRTARRDR